MSLLNEFPLDGVDLDRRVNEVLGVPGVSMMEPEDGPGVRYVKYISLDSEAQREAGFGRILEFFVETRVAAPPKNGDGYVMDEVQTISGVMMRRGMGKTESDDHKMVAYFVDGERFISEYLTDTVSRIRCARWFEEFRNKSAFDDEVLETVNRNYLPSLDRDHFKKVLH